MAFFVNGWNISSNMRSQIRKLVLDGHKSHTHNTEALVMASAKEWYWPHSHLPTSDKQSLDLFFCKPLKLVVHKTLIAGSEHILTGLLLHIRLISCLVLLMPKLPLSIPL